MKLVTYRHGEGNSRPGAIVGESPSTHRVVDLSPVAADIVALIAGGQEFLERARRLLDDGSAESHPVSEVHLLAPIPRPRKIICLAGNYRAHQEEGHLTIVEKSQQSPWLFLKPDTTVIGPGEAVRLPGALSDQIDWECELGAVIGRRAANVLADRALDYVVGYTVFNDVSARAIAHPPEHRVRERDPFHDWLHGKWFDTFGPMGPCLTTSDDIPDPQSLNLELRLNGQVRQQASTGEMIFSVAELVEFISQIVTLEPGDLISTGTPAGVGKAAGRLLREGDVMDAEIERIGTLHTPVVAS